MPTILKHSRRVTQLITASIFRHDKTTTKLQLIGIMPKEREQQLTTSDHWEIDVPDGVNDLDAIKMAYIQSLSKLQLLQSVSTMGLSRLKETL